MDEAAAAAAEAAGLQPGGSGCPSGVCQHSGVLCAGPAWHSMTVDTAGVAAAATAVGMLVFVMDCEHVAERPTQPGRRHIAVVGRIYIGRLVCSSRSVACVCV